MTAYKCDLCLCYCDDCYSIELPNATIKSTRRFSTRNTRKVEQICDGCYDKLQKWVNENVKDEGGKNE